MADREIPGSLVSAQHTQSTPRRGIKSVGKIFISYRRDDSATIAGRIHDWLVQRVPSADVFFDMDSIQYGVDFERRIQSTIPHCKAVLAIIGPRWLTGDGHPSEQVTKELELARSHSVATIPVLVENATMPADEHLPPSLQRFQMLNAAQVRTGRDFQRDMEDLAKALGIPLAPRSLLDPRSARFWAVSAAVLVLLSLSIAGLFTGLLPRPSAPTDPYASATVTQGVANETDTAASESTVSAAAQNTAVAATATQGAAATATATALAPYSYSAHLPGPGTACDPRGHWQLQLASYGGGFACQADGVHVAAGYGSSTSLDFDGASGFTFPVRSVTSIDVANLQGAECATMDYSYYVATTNDTKVIWFSLCEGGSWSAGERFIRNTPPVAIGSGTVTAATSYHLAVTLDGSSLHFAINGQAVATYNEISRAADNMGFEVSTKGADKGSLTLANFAVVALP